MKPKRKLSLISLFITGIIAFFSASFLHAQENPPLPAEFDVTSANFVELTDKEIFLSTSILIFGMMTLALQAYLLKANQSDSSAILLSFTVTLVIIAGLFLITVGLSSDQIAPAFSLYGAIVGYLLGKGASKEEK